ncbi:oocyte zinc finger protein XlCOF6-like [Phlebotomus papatasi]|uniref:oocyte zinc finger protein XlCOF6-like n=1 Tax=Phlebotomus papatasi TaxID=29031 RepID=UPI002483A9BE|nr:oocyte zinc finger protein XlCOF6-like [Phlebotomus papatasi]
MEYIDIADNCRTCQIKTQEESQKIFIFNTMKLPDIFKETTSLDIHENDGLPKVLCSTCYDRLLEAYNFRKMCSAAVLHFQKILSMDVPEEKYTPPEDLTPVKAVPDILSSSNSSMKYLKYLPEKEDALTDISDTLSIDDKLPDELKTDPDDVMEREEKPSEQVNDMDNLQGTNSLPDKSYYPPDKHNPSIEDPKKLQMEKGEQLPESQKKKKPNIPGEPTKLECGICSSKFRWKGRLEMHMKKVHLGLNTIAKKAKTNKIEKTKKLKKEIWDTCELCPYKTRIRGHLKRHMKGVHERLRDVRCSQCNRVFTTERGLKLHMVCHEGGRNHKDSGTKEKKFTCELCPYKTDLSATLKRHVKAVHQKLKDFQCTRCERSFTMESSLKIHMMRHEGIKNYECPICGVKKVAICELKSHMFTHTKEKTLSCEFCPYKCNARTNMRLHVKAVHQRIKEHHCAICNSSFGAARSLKLHLMTHTGEKPHVCSECNKSFRRLNQLNIHMNIHTRENIFSCESCSFKTIYPRTLKAHVSVVHKGVKNYHCPHCEKSFGSPGNLRVHVMAHMGEKPHTCSECGKKFIEKSAMKKHMKTHLRSGRSGTKSASQKKIKKESKQNPVSNPESQSNS